MTPERWHQVEEVLQGALDRPATERALFVEQVCDGDIDLKRQAISLISAHDRAGNFIEESAMAANAHLLLGNEVGLEIGPYKIIESLGSGGMGEVYLARDTRLDRPVALKILPSYFAADDARLRRFQREARTASALNHPNIITIHEVGEHGDIRFIAAEFVDGKTLRDLMESSPLSPADIVDITAQVATGLAAAHAAGIVHRDIKPENIMRREDGLVKILDFGIAKLVEQETLSVAGKTLSDIRLQTEVGVVMGTVNYMSPEQARALDVDERTDIWSLGVMLFEMLEDRLPFQGDTRMDILVSILEREPESTSIATGGGELERLQRVAKKALLKDRNERYQNAVELLNDLKRGSEEARGEFASPLDSAVGRSSSRFSNVVMWLALAAVLMAVLAGVFVFKKQLVGRQVEGPPAAVASKAYLLMSEAEQLAFIEQQEQRVSTMMGDRHVTLNDEALRAIKNYVDRYVSLGGKSPDLGDEALESVYGRAQAQVPLIARTFAARKVPVIIGIYLPVVESAYRDCYENATGAKGLFQFLPQTARQYGVSPEQMCDVEKMAPAAAHYIADRMAELGEDSQSLTLVLLSYNNGPEAVRNSLRELRGTDNYQRNFWTLFAHRERLGEQFRQESAGYVPAFFAAAIIGENPQAFGLSIPPLSSLAREASSKQ